jgi:hypothetical protein
MLIDEIMGIIREVLVMVAAIVFVMVCVLVPLLLLWWILV